MRPEVQEILDKPFEDRFYPKDGKYYKKGDLIHYGEYYRFRALVKLFYWAEDIGDIELTKDAEQAADSIKKPDDPEKTYSGKSMHWKDAGAHGVIHHSKGRFVTFNEKHGSYHYDIGTPTKAASAFLTVLNERLTDGHWYSDEHEEEVPDQLSLIESNDVPLTEKLEAEKIIAFARGDEPGALVRAGKSAYLFLHDRTNAEYEDFNIETATVAEFV